jgi:hypothetical protein
VSSGNLDQFGAYRKALELFDLVVADVTHYLGDRKLERLVSQQLASAVRPGRRNQPYPERHHQATKREISGKGQVKNHGQKDHSEKRGRGR